MSRPAVDRSDPLAVETRHDGKFAFVDSAWRHQGMVALMWRPPPPSPFWSFRGTQSVLVTAMIGSARDGRGLSTREILERMGVSCRVVEDEFSCRLQLTGEHHALRAAVAHVEAAVGQDRIAPDALSEALRALTHRQRIRRASRSARAGRDLWHAFLDGPERLWRDLGEFANDDTAAILERGGAGGLGADGAVVIGCEPVAGAWSESPCWRVRTDDGADPIEPAASPAPAGRCRVIRPSPTGQALVSYGAVRRSGSIEEHFAQELAIEILAGWAGSALHVLLREKLALTYGVAAASRIFGLGRRPLLSWTVELVTAAVDAPEAGRRIAAVTDELIERPPSEDDVRRTANRIVRRSRVLQDSVSDIMRAYGHPAQEGLPRLAVDRWRYLQRATAADVAAELTRMRHEGIFTIVGSGSEGYEDVDL